MKHLVSKLAMACVVAGVALGGMARAQLASSASSSKPDPIAASEVQQGYDISPIPKSRLNLKGKNSDLVGLGSYLVNGVGDCSGCHTYPEYLATDDTAGSNPTAGDPFSGTPSSQGTSTQLTANFNVSHYMAGGQCFGPVMARNIAPDDDGLPEGLTEDAFITAMRTGEDVHCEASPSDPICAIEPDAPVLQVMPWPTYHSMTTRELEAIYEYLTALPSANPCNTPADGCPGFSGLAASSSSYAYANSDDCPNPAPAQ
ncbi:MAG TPA: hypothetical protein VEJ86_04850 [Candidatus Binataceae bacterium]|nr:hypothetical protein [Candidatus Binataceae bacterium]